MNHGFVALDAVLRTGARSDARRAGRESECRACCRGECTHRQDLKEDWSLIAFERPLRLIMPPNVVPVGQKLLGAAETPCEKAGWKFQRNDPGKCRLHDLQSISGLSCLQANSESSCQSMMYETQVPRLELAIWKS